MADVSQHEIKRRILERFKTVPLQRWGTLKQMIAYPGGLVSAEEVRLAVNELVTEKKFTLFSGRNGGIYVALPQYTEGIDAPALDSITE